MTKNQLKPYMGYSRVSGPEEGAILIFAHDAKEARRIGYPYMTDWFSDDWLDCAVKWKKKSKHLYAEANKEKLANGQAHVIDSPRTCTRCELWGAPMTENGICEDCADLELQEAQ